VKMNAAEALFNISCSSIPETTDRVAGHPNLLMTLASALKTTTTSLSSSSPSNNTTPRDVKIYCAATLRRLSEITHSPSPHHSMLLSSLTHASSGSNGWRTTPCIAESFVLQATNPKNRPAMVEEEGLLTALAELSLGKGCGGMVMGEAEGLRGVGLGAVELLRLWEGGLGRMGRHEGIMMALTRASYGDRGSGIVGRKGVGMGRSASLRRNSSFRSAKSNGGSLKSSKSNADSFMSSKSRGDEDDNEWEDGDGGDEYSLDDLPSSSVKTGESISGQQRRIQDTLKKLVAAM